MINMLIGNLLLLLNLSYFSNEMLKLKYKNRIHVIAGVVLGVAILTSRSYPSLQLYGTFIMISYYFLFVFNLYLGTVIQKVLTIFVFVAIASISEVLASNILNLIFDLQSTDLNTFLYTFALVFSNCLTLAMLGIISKYIQLNSKMKLPKTTWLVFALPLTTFLFVISLNEFFEAFRNNVLVAPIILGLLIANFVTIYIFFQTIKTIELKNEIKGMQVKYDTINSLYQNNFDFMHDTIWELNNIYKNIEEKKYEVLSDQLEGLSNNILEKFNVINTNSTIISSCLNYRLGDVTKYNIKVKTDILFNNFSFLSIQTQNELFATLINNAVDSCINTNFDKKNILIKTSLLDSSIMIKCIYSFTKEFDDENIKAINKIRKLLLTTKSSINTFFENENYYEIVIVFNDL